MQGYILRKKNEITLISGILIAIAFISKLGFGNIEVFNISLIIASILGVAPIALQSYQALRVKVIQLIIVIMC